MAQSTDFVIVDIDNCDSHTKLFIALILTQPNAHYLTSDEITPWHLISKKRIYNLDWINEILDKEDDEDEDA